ncbi:hypothetical protein BD309DRAFT_989589 [Dichomitus squalens]|uniref:Uncharacterized protein n=1 Tax=Dichomitus squalens TaxID=114155 RepID=A0A4Q9PJ16_9APHY|nr:hypothetical protein BD311DRAFT_651198 [Dichomitus squalens]TBU45417.1 hypothetical protein BD309DRAFT_989589 [Dichomitus squalens]TBU54070.1 hypothetical protein BD310DRAFT_828788 [Dichomitus squalens]
MSQHRFRVNPQPSYSERMTQTRSELRTLVKQKLCDITGEPNAQMRWTRTAYMRDVVSRYRVRIEGWPLSEIPLKNLSDVPNLGKLELLLARWRAGTIYFRRISQAEYDAMVADPVPWVGPEEQEQEREHEDA